MNGTNQLGRVSSSLAASYALLQLLLQTGKNFAIEKISSSFAILVEESSSVLPVDVCGHGPEVSRGMITNAA